MSPPDKNAGRPAQAAANVTNTLSPEVVRLPLGHTRSYPPDQSPSVFRFRLPSKLGGLLEIETGHNADIHLRRGFADEDVASAKATKFLRYKVPAGLTYGFYFIVVDAPGATVTVKFSEKGTARDGSSSSDPPLIPWNFWYWPISRGSKMDPPPGTPQNALDRFAKYQKSADHDLNFWTFTARETLSKYCRALGLEDSSAIHFEIDNHQEPLTYGWAGHCHNAAPASVLFEPLKAKTLHGENFSADELEFLATEFTGNYDDSPSVYRLGQPMDPSEMPVLGLFKPEGACDDAELKNAVDEINPTNVEAAKTYYDEVKKRRDSQYGSTPDAIKVAFGQEAAELFRVLQDELLVMHNPLTGDLRSVNASGDPNQVWNEAVFCYEASYEEADPTKNDDLIIRVNVTVYANVDSAPPGSGGLPGSVKDNEVIPDTSSQPDAAWVFEYGFLLQFTNAGRVGTYEYSTHRWVHCRARGDGPIYAPRRLIRTAKPQPKRLGTDGSKERNFVLGNSAVTWDFVTSGLGTLRAKYK